MKAKREQCSSLRSESKIAIEEKKRKVVFLNPKNAHQYTVTQVDGCMVENEVTSDYVVTRDDLGDVVVELKGTDVDHAMQQIEATAEMWHTHRLRSGKLAGLVICAQYPRIDTKIQRAKDRMAKRYKAPLHVLSRNSELEFARVLEFKDLH